MDINLLKPNDSNPRLINDAQFIKLKESLKSFPKMMELRPIIVDENNIIQGGNMRFKALKDLGFKEIPETWVKQAKDFTVQ
jgi:ParB-like chromosome segregation protein Spo0J